MSEETQQKGRWMADGGYCVICQDELVSKSQSVLQNTRFIRITRCYKVKWKPREEISEGHDGK